MGVVQFKADATNIMLHSGLILGRFVLLEKDTERMGRLNVSEGNRGENVTVSLYQECFCRLNYNWPKFEIEPGLFVA